MVTLAPVWKWTGFWCEILFGLPCFLTGYFCHVCITIFAFTNNLSLIFGLYTWTVECLWTKIKILVIPDIYNPASTLATRATLTCWERNTTHAGSGSVAVICSSNASAQPAGEVKSGECPMPRHPAAKTLTPRNYFSPDSSNSQQATWMFLMLLFQTGDPFV